MADITNSLATATRVQGAVAVGLVDMESGRCIAGSGIERLDLDAMAVKETEILRSQMDLLEEMGSSSEEIEEIMMVAGGHIHIIRPVRREENPELFLYLALDARDANLGLARFQLNQVERELTL